MTDPLFVTQLPISFYQAVLANMVRSGHGKSVRFGIMGRGIQPNYQIAFADGVVRTYRGGTHRPYLETGAAFSASNLSREFAFEEMVALSK